MNGSYDLLIVGVGGQGTILASNVIGEACLTEGKSVRGAETHGMSQRGGSVESQIRIGGEYGPLISSGTADMIIAFDMLEALRYRHFLKDGGVIVTNKNIVVPTSVFQQGLEVPVPEDTVQSLDDVNLYVIDAEMIASEAGSTLAQNIVMLGSASVFMPLSVDSLLKAIKESVPPKTVDINVAAFNMGREAAERLI
ncbi:MAG: indolepyruvate oxidoreductase subunit beta [Euryarchaeota archaeon]|nr:indolepyruvate oxidoreductase subunit beta [Euryarchaeota archaeon]